MLPSVSILVLVGVTRSLRVNNAVYLSLAIELYQLRRFYLYCISQDIDKHSVGLLGNTSSIKYTSLGVHLADVRCMLQYNMHEHSAVHMQVCAIGSNRCGDCTSTTCASSTTGHGDQGHAQPAMGGVRGLHHHGSGATALSVVRRKQESTELLTRPSPPQSLCAIAPGVPGNHNGLGDGECHCCGMVRPATAQAGCRGAGAPRRGQSNGYESSAWVAGSGGWTSSSGRTSLGYPIRCHTGLRL